MGSLYDTDFAAWSAEQASVLRDAGRRRVNAPVDWENVAEEIEGLGRSERRELRSRIGTIIEHLLKLEASPAVDPQRAWRDTVRGARRHVALVLEDSPSLRPHLPAIVAEELAAAREMVRGSLADHGETPLRPLDAITYDEAQVLGGWLPDLRPRAALGAKPRRR